MEYTYHRAKEGARVSKNKIDDWGSFEVTCMLCARTWEVNFRGYKLNTGCPKCRPNLFVDYKVTRYDHVSD